MFLFVQCYWMHALFKLFSMKCKELCKRLIARLPDKILKYSTSIKKKKNTCIYFNSDHMLFTFFFSNKDGKYVCYLRHARRQLFAKILMTSNIASICRKLFCLKTKPRRQFREEKRTKFCGWKFVCGLLFMKNLSKTNTQINGKKS